jgi:hypothetical protein
MIPSDVTDGVKIDIGLRDKKNIEMLNDPKRKDKYKPKLFLLLNDGTNFYKLNCQS